MDDIALAAEITKPTIYQYFDTKGQLYFTLMNPFIEELACGTEKKVLDGGYDKGASSVSASLNKKGKLNFERLRRGLALGVEQGLLRDYNVYQLADVFWGLFVGVVQLSDVKSHRTSRNPEANRTDPNLEASLKLAEKLVTDAVALP